MNLSMNYDRVWNERLIDPEEKCFLGSKSEWVRLSLKTNLADGFTEFEAVLVVCLFSFGHTLRREILAQ